MELMAGFQELENVRTAHSTQARQLLTEVMYLRIWLALQD